MIHTAQVMIFPTNVNKKGGGGNVEVSVKTKVAWPHEPILGGTHRSLRMVAGFRIAFIGNAEHMRRSISQIVGGVGKKCRYIEKP